MMWQYLEVTTDGNGRVKYVNGVTVAESGNFMFPDYINGLGEKNWELVAVGVYSFKSGFDSITTYTFKRQKPL